MRRLAPDGLEAWAQVLASGYEGLVAKDEESSYVGGRTRAWLKVKVPGWTALKVTGVARRQSAVAANGPLQWRGQQHVRRARGVRARPDQGQARAQGRRIGPPSVASCRR